MVGSKDEKHPEQLLEQFWLELADSDIDLDKTTLPHPSDSIFQLIEQFMPFRRTMMTLNYCHNKKSI